MTPIISNKTQFDYELLKKDAKFMYIKGHLGEKGNETLPHIVMGQESDLLEGVSIEVLNDGINFNITFTDFMTTINKKTITKDIDEGLSDWLIDNRREDLVIQ